MMMQRLLRAAFCFLALAVPLLAFASAGPRLEFEFKPNQAKLPQKQIKKWLKAHSKREFPAKIEALAKRSLIAFAPERDEYLRDAVASPAPPKGAGESAVLCQTLEACPTLATTAHADNYADIPQAAAILLQPWLLIQQKRGGEARLQVAEAASDALLTLNLQGVFAAPIELRASQDFPDGLHLWLSGSQDLNEIYAFSREAVLNPSQPSY